ncbi:MAG: UDP-2,3-diacylglucosamine diphosphatase LpxI [Nitratireductor sp.]
MRPLMASTPEATGATEFTRRVAIVAGGGRLPADLALGLAARGQNPFVVIVGGEVRPDSPLWRFEHEVIELEEFGRLVGVLKTAGVSHVVLAGAIERRPALSRLKWTVDLIAMLPRVVATLGRGDDGILRAIVGFLESRGFAVMGAHEILPDLVATAVTLTRARPTAKDRRDISAARTAARAIGALDIGQAAVAIGGRVVALEGIEGTDGLLARVAHLRTHGRIAASSRGVLVKCAKPGQELRADLPAIGPNSVEGAHAAGLVGIAVEAGRSIILDQGKVIETANRLGLFVTGVDERDP